MRDWFRRFSATTSSALGTPLAFGAALSLVLLWIVGIAYVGLPDWYQLVINTSTTIVTFLMVFLIQNTQNRDSKAIHLKLDELLRGTTGARTAMVNLENLSDDELEKLQVQFERIQQARSGQLDDDEIIDAVEETHETLEAAQERQLTPRNGKR